MVMPAGMVVALQVPEMLFPVIEVKIVGTTVVMATNGPVVKAVFVTSRKPEIPIEYWIA